MVTMMVIFTLLMILLLVVAGYLVAEESSAWFIPFMIAILFSLMVLISAYEVGMSSQRELLTECEKDLPRNEYCKIIAVPENVGE